MVKIELEITKEQANILREMVCDYQDCGPYGEGWKSDETAELSSLIDDKIMEALKWIK